MHLDLRSRARATPARTRGQRRPCAPHGCPWARRGRARTKAVGGRIQKLPTGRGSRHHYYISSRLHSTQDFHASTVHWTWRALHVRTGKHRSASPAVPRRSRDPRVGQHATRIIISGRRDGAHTPTPRHKHTDARSHTPLSTAMVCSCCESPLLLTASRRSGRLSSCPPSRRRCSTRG